MGKHRQALEKEINRKADRVELQQLEKSVSQLVDSNMKLGERVENASKSIQKDITDLTIELERRLPKTANGL